MSGYGDKSQDSLSVRVTRAIKWSSITEILTKLVSPLTNAILARLLVPEVFGVVATLTLVVSFAEIFTDAGFQKYIVQHEFESQEDLDVSTDVAFWTNLIISLLFWGIIAVFAKPIAAMVGSEGYEDAVIVISAQIPLLALYSIPMARCRRDFDFKNLFFVRISVSLVPLFITVPAALLFRSHWAIVIGTLSRDVLNAVMISVRSTWKPKFRYYWNKLKEMLAFTIWSTVESVTIWLSTNIDVFLLSSTLTPYYLGMFKTTISTGNAYLGIITASTMPVLFSALSRTQRDLPQFQEVFFKFQRMVALVLFPLGVGAYVYRDFVTLVLLGSQWTETADFLGLWFLIGSIKIVLSDFNSEAYRSMGKPKLSILVQLLHIAALIPCLIWGLGQPYSVMTGTRALIRLEIIAVNAVVMQLMVKIRFAQAVGNVAPAMLSSVVMAIAGVLLQRVSDHMLWQAVSIVICAIVYGISMWILPAGRKNMMEIPLVTKFCPKRKTSSWGT